MEEGQDFPGECPMKRIKLDDVPVVEAMSTCTGEPVSEAETGSATAQAQLQVDGGCKDEAQEDSEDEGIQFQCISLIKLSRNCFLSGDDASSQSSFGEEDIENMLDEGLPDDLKNKKNSQREERFKIILEERGKNHFEVLPEGWVQVTHNTGMPVYLHKPTRVCCVARPYFLGPGSVRVSHTVDCMALGYTRLTVTHPSTNYSGTRFP